MIKAIVKETELVEPKSSNLISTLYFGGGTPSILDADDLAIIFEALQKRFVFTNDIEITLEANPDDITNDKLQLWKELGVNRLSVGIQSFVDKDLKWMNRAHNASESLMCIDKIITAGFTNFSVDLIYGSPVLSDEEWKRNIDVVIEKNIPHISCYALTVEPKTALDKMITLHKKENVDADKQARQFILLMDRMAAAGYEHYEISNFAKPGFRSRHNSSYWSGEKYYGIGPAAHSYFPGGESPGIPLPVRRWNIANNSLYIQSLQNNRIPFEEEVLTNIQQLNEYIMTSLRTAEGLDLSRVSSVFGDDKDNSIRASAVKYIESGKLEMLKNKMVLTRQGKLFADGIAADLFF